MARPRVFVSSTYYDLKYVRSSLDNFIETLGFEPVLFEKGDIAFSPDISIDESCYREVANADVFVLIVGGRYGSAASSVAKKPSRTALEQFDSVTKKEYQEATTRDIPTYILIEHNVYAEYQTYLKNRENKNIEYAHVDSINIFKLIQDILSKPRNNPLHTFERFSDIEEWLRDQWAGLFRELLQRRSAQKQILALSAQVDTLAAINGSLQKYLETIVSKVIPEEESDILIRSERKKIDDVRQIELIINNDFYNFISKHLTANNVLTAELFRTAIIEANNYEELRDIIFNIVKEEDVKLLFDALADDPSVIDDLNELRKFLGLSVFRNPPAL